MPLQDDGDDELVTLGGTVEAAITMETLRRETLEDEELVKVMAAN